MAKKKKKKKPAGKGRFQIWAEYAAVRTAEKLIGLLPERGAIAFARAAGTLAWLIKGDRRRDARRNLSRAMPELSRAEVNRIVRQVFVHLALEFRRDTLGPAKCQSAKHRRAVRTRRRGGG